MPRRLGDDVQIMSSTELMHNCLYVKNREVWYRDYSVDVPLRELIRSLYEEHCDVDDIREMSDDDLDEMLIDDAQFGIHDMRGVISMINFFACGYADLREWLKEYEEQRVSFVERPDTINKAISHYGELNQMIKAVEELNELSQSLCKFIEVAFGANAGKPDNWKAIADARASVYEEMADVMIMMRQLFRIFQCLPRVEQNITEKLDRLEKTIKEEESK